MNKSGECPKCKSYNIWNDAHIPDWHFGNQLTIMARTIFVKKPKRFWDVPIRARYVVYVCLDCGYSERYIDDEGLETIKEHGMPKQD